MSDNYFGRIIKDPYRWLENVQAGGNAVYNKKPVSMYSGNISLNGSHQLMQVKKSPWNYPAFICQDDGMVFICIKYLDRLI